MGVLAQNPVWQGFLDRICQAFAWIYELMPDYGRYGLAIVLLTVLIRILLIPLGIKQIHGMQAMQSIQPKIKALQAKYKGNKQKQQEEVMKLYRESGVNPFGGCWPTLLQLPIFIALYSVLRPPVPANGDFLNNHLPEKSEIYHNVVVEHSGTDFLWMNLQCGAGSAGKPDVPVLDNEGNPTNVSIDCGSGGTARIPYYLALALMVGSTYFSSRQMQKASPPGSVSQQQKTLTMIMPLTFLLFGFQFPAGLVVYWTTSNLWQIGQQFVLLKAGHIGPGALDAAAERAKRKAEKRGDRKGMFTSMQERAEEERRRREGGGSTGSPAKPRPKPKPAGGSGGSGATGARSRKKRPKR